MTVINSLLIVAITLQLKHLVIDWMWQPPYEFLNKGTYLHWGGLRHALKNATGTAAVFLLAPVSWYFIICVLIVDFVIHYHIDWCKVCINKFYSWRADRDAEFWYLTGIDQFLHQMTYLMLIAVAYSPV